MGAYMSDFAVFIPTYAGTGMLTGCYDIPYAYANVKGIYTNTGLQTHIEVLAGQKLLISLEG